MIPINQEENNRFSLQPYDRKYYLKRGPTINADTEQAIVTERAGDDETDFDVYELEHDD